MKQLDDAGVSQVGIFWILPEKLLAFGVPYTAGEKYGDFINIPDGHYEIWRNSERHRENCQRIIHPIPEVG